MEEDLPRSQPDTPKPQRSKRSEALINLAEYFEKFLRGVAVRSTDDAIESAANQMAIDAYKIVKQAEGFDV